MEWVTFSIAVAGFLMSLATWIHEFWVNQKHLDVSMSSSFYDEGHIYVLFLLINKSKQPISVANGSLLLKDNSTCSFGETSNAIFNYLNPQLSGKASERTLRFPVRLDSFEAITVLVELTPWSRDKTELVPSQCDVTLGTSRGRVRRKCRIPVYSATWKEILPYIR